MTELLLPGRISHFTACVPLLAYINAYYAPVHSDLITHTLPLFQLKQTDISLDSSGFTSGR